MRLILNEMRLIFASQLIRWAARLVPTDDNRAEALIYHLMSAVDVMLN